MSQEGTYINQAGLLPLLNEFKQEKILSQDLVIPTIYLLGTLKGVQSILHIEKNNFDASELAAITAFSKATLTGQNDVYTWATAWFTESRSADVKIYLISPCTEKHIRKYSSQKRYMFSETPQVYETVVKPYIDAMPSAPIQWVFNILDGKKEQEDILHAEGGSGEEGFMIMPDSKWDKKNVKTLYLQAIVQSRSIKSLRDLEPKHLPLLKRIRQAAEDVCVKHYHLEPNTIRVFVHYHPTYYHFHVHIANIDNDGHGGTRIGKAHMLDDLISLLEISSKVSPSESLIRQMTYTYVLGEQDALLSTLRKAGLTGAPQAQLETN